MIKGTTQTWVMEQICQDPVAIRSFAESFIDMAASVGEPPEMVYVTPLFQGTKYRRSTPRNIVATFESLKDADRVSLVCPNHGAKYTDIEFKWFLQYEKPEARLAVGVATSSSLSFEDFGGGEIGRMLDRVVFDYAYRFVAENWRGPKLYALGIVLGDRHKDLAKNESGLVHEWSGSRSRAIGAGVLRDVYPQSWLTHRFLDAPMGCTGVSLRDWIIGDSSRGVIHMHSKHVAEWRVSPSAIPRVREALYRAGRILDYRFADPSSHLYRPDLTAPWEAPDPIPEIFRADFYKDKDPGLTL